MAKRFKSIVGVECLVIKKEEQKEEEEGGRRRKGRG